MSTEEVGETIEKKLVEMGTVAVVAGVFGFFIGGPACACACAKAAASATV